MANQPTRTGLQPATIPRKVQEIVFRHTAEDTTPIAPNIKQSGCKYHAITSDNTMSVTIRGRAFCGGYIRFDGNTLSRVLFILASMSLSR